MGVSAISWSQALHKERLGTRLTASSTSITKFIEFGKGHQKSRLTEKASKLKIDYLAFLKNGSTGRNKAWIILLVRR